MRLTLDFETQYGFSAPEAYVRVLEYKGNENLIKFKVGVWYDYPAYFYGKAPLERYDYAAPFTDGMSTDDLYAWLKVNSTEFFGAVDFVEPVLPPPAPPEE